MKNTKRVFYSIVPVVIVASLGSLFVNLGLDWFDKLNKPTEWIPNFVIPIVWTIIYSITAIGLFRILGREKLEKETVILFIINGILNILWCLIFFTLRAKFFGLITIIINLIFSILLLKNLKKNFLSFYYALSIYPIWLSIATSLNLAIWIMN